MASMVATICKGRHPMKPGPTLMGEIKKRVGPVAPEPQPVPARTPRQPAQEWIARNRCW